MDWFSQADNSFEQHNIADLKSGTYTAFEFQKSSPALQGQASKNQNLNQTEISICRYTLNVDLSTTSEVVVRGPHVHNNSKKILCVG